MISRAWRRAGAAIGVGALALTLAVSSPAQASPSSDALVLSWYSSFLGRADPAADSGRLHWVARIDSGQRPSDALWEILHSREYRERQIASFYTDYLGRPVDPGARYWLDQVHGNRMTLEQVAQSILASPEYARRGGVVWAWYEDILGRSPRGDDVLYWYGRLDEVGDAQVVREIYYSEEAVRLRVYRNFSAVLDRIPGITEMRYWSPKQSESDVNVKTLLASTPEYQWLRGRP